MFSFKTFKKHVKNVYKKIRFFVVFVFVMSKFVFISKRALNVYFYLIIRMKLLIREGNKPEYKKIQNTSHVISKVLIKIRNSFQCHRK